MPELPEAEANRRRIEAGALNRTVEAVRLGADTAHVDLPAKAERDRLEGRRFTEARRYGKLVFAGAKSGPWIAVHLGMTGSLRVYDEAEGAPDYARIMIAFEGDRRLAFRCPRKLGWVKVIDDPGAFVAEEGYGPDALQIRQADFAARLGRGAVKPALMDQAKVAGIGNLWSDEILFHSDTAPDARAADLSEARVGELFAAMHRLFGGALQVHADYSALPGDWLVHNRTEGADCPRCGGTIAKKKVGGRTAYYCPGHQKAAA
jgi:formamidopyrimidine-DNA glycosylase